MTLTKHDSASMSVNLEMLAAPLHDVAGLRWDSLSRHTGEVRHAWHPGEHSRDSAHGRDYPLVCPGHQFR